MFGNFSKSFGYGKRGPTSPYGIILPDTSGTTEVTWTDNTYFDFYSVQTSSTTDILAGVQNRVYQLCFAHQQVTLPADAVNRLGVGTYSTQVASPKRWWFAQGIADNIQRMASPTMVALTSDGTSNFSSSPGAFVEVPMGSAYTIPANRWFIVGHSIIPFRAVRSQASPRTAVISGTYYVTAFPTLFEYGSQSENRVPLQMGGFGRPFRIWTGYTHVMSMKFKL